MSNDPVAPRPDAVTNTPPAPAPEPASSTAVQAAPDATIPLPPPPVPAPPETLPAEAVLARLRRWDLLLAGVVLALAFLTALFPISNADFLLHLATGRLIAQGAFSFGADPFTFTAETVTWVNHNWLYDLALYLLYQASGSSVALLIVLKAVVVAGLAGLLLRLGSRPGQTLWVPAVVTALAVLAVSPRLYLQPIVLSMLLLALTLWLLRTGRHWLIPPVCLLWVNLDQWFVLGPLCVALYAAGVLLQRVLPQEEAEPEGASPQTLGLVLLASLLACVVNPYHIRAFEIPAALGLHEAGAVLGKDSQFRVLYLSPWDRAYFQRNIGLSAAGLSGLVLALVGATSFGLILGRWSWWRVLLWLGFFVLALVNVRNIPFFAIVAGPITALNFLDYARARMGGDWTPMEYRQAVAGRALTLVFGVLLLALAVPGWLQHSPHRQRRVGLGLELDAGMQQTALQIKEWRDRGQIEPGQRWFNTAPEVVYYMAWYCPGEKGFLDLRLQLFGKVAEEYLQVRRDLGGERAPGEGEEAQKGRPAEPAWNRVFARHQIDLLIYQSYSPSLLLSGLERLYSNPDEWTACQLSGRTSIFAWKKDPEKRDRSALALDFDRLAFGPEGVRAPGTRAPQPASLPWYLEPFAVAPTESAASWSAFQNTARFEGMRYWYAVRNQDEGMALPHKAAWLVGLSAGPGGPLLNGSLMPGRVVSTYKTYVVDPRFAPGPAEGRTVPPPTTFDRFWLDRLTQYMQASDGGPPSSLYLAVRLARQGLHDNPSDSRTYITLADAYLRLQGQTRERVATGPYFLHASMIRHSQVAGALNGCLKLDPAPEVAQHLHIQLAAQVYRPQPRVYFIGPGEPTKVPDPYLEVRVKHLQEYLRLCRELGNIPGVPPDQYLKALDKVAEDIKKQERALSNAQNKYEVSSANKPVLQKAVIALQNGLAETALSVIQKADPKERLDKRNPNVDSALTLAIDLLLELGRLDEAREDLKPELASADKFDKRIYGLHPLLLVPAYDWLQAQLAAASGDYDLADEHLAEISKGLLDQTGAGGPLDQVALLVGATLLAEAPRAAHLPWLPTGAQLAVVGASERSAGYLQQQADIHTIRAWVALEAGNRELARTEGERALALGEVGGGLALRLPSRPLAGLVRDLLQSGGK